MTTPTPEVRTGYMRDVVGYVLYEIKDEPHAKQIELVWDIREAIDKGPLKASVSDRVCAIVDRLYGLAPKLTREDLSSAVAGAAFSIETVED